MGKMLKMSILIFLTFLLGISSAAINSPKIISDFTLRLALGLNRERENLFISGLSVELALSMTHLGAKGQTASQISDALGYEGADASIHRDNRNLLTMNGYNLNKNYTLDIANNIYVNENFELLEKFKDDAQYYYQSPVQSLDFGGDPDGSAQWINEFIEQKTHNMIKDFFSPRSFTPATAAVLVNAIYFRGFWTIPFEPSDTKVGYFHLGENEEPIQTTYMSLFYREFNYVDLPDLNAQGLQLDYKGDDVKMIVLLPNGNVKLEDVLNSLNSRLLTDIPDQMSKVMTNLKLPKFTMKTKYSDALKVTLQNMGIQNLFSKGTCDLSGISTQRQLYVDFIQHEAAIEVDEVGTKASGVTGVGIMEMAARPTVNFHVTRPFLFWILDRRIGMGSDNVLFFGIFHKPN